MKTAVAKTVATKTSRGSAGLFMRILARAGSGLAGTDLGFDCEPACDRGRSRISAKVADVVKTQVQSIGKVKDDLRKRN